MAVITPGHAKHTGAVQHALEWLRGETRSPSRVEVEIREDAALASELAEDAHGSPSPQTRMEPLEGELLFQLYMPGASGDQLEIVWQKERETLVVAVEDASEASGGEWLWYSATWFPQCDIAGATAWIEGDLVSICLPIKAEYQGVVIPREAGH